MLLSKFQRSILLALNFTATVHVLFPVQAKGHCLTEFSVTTHPQYQPLTLGCLPVGNTKCTWDTNSLQSAQTTVISRTANTFHSQELEEKQSFDCISNPALKSGLKTRGKNLPCTTATFSKLGLWDYLP